MFAKVFEQIFDSSIAEDWQVRHVFEDFLKLSDKHGIVDKTPEAIARRTNVPLEIVKRAIDELEKPDPQSRTKEKEGRRIERLDPDREWGWQIVNYVKYRESATKEMLRMAEADRKKAYRARQSKSPLYPPKSTRSRGRHVPGHVPDITPKDSYSSNFEAIKLEGELKRLTRELEKLGDITDWDKGSENHTRIKELRERRNQLRQILQVKA